MRDSVTFKEPVSYMAFGIRGSGKSTLLEHIALQFLKNNCPVLDLFGSRDGEGLAWLRSPEAKNLKILLLHGDNTSIASSWDSKRVSDFTAEDFDKYDLVISSSPLYSSQNEEYRGVNKVIDKVYGRNVWTRPCYLIVREAANLFYSRLKVSPDQIVAKGEVVYFIREARHSGFSLGLDTQKITSIDSDIRITIDFFFFKSLGIVGLPDDFRFLYSTYQPLRLQKMDNEYFILLTRTGSHGVGSFPYHGWHKVPGEPLLRNLGIDVSHGDELVENRPNYIVGDLLHSALIELRNGGDSYNQMAEKKGISKSTAYSHVEYHNKKVNTSGVCDKCERSKSDLAPLLIKQ